MPNHKVIPETRICPTDGIKFEVGGRGRRKRTTVYCSDQCARAQHAQKITIAPELRVCPVDGATFEVGGRGRLRKSTVYCSIKCVNVMRSRLAPHAGSHAPRPRAKFQDTLHDESWLRARYVDERLTMAQVAELADGTSTGVFVALRKFGIPSRTRAESMPKKPYRPTSPPRAGLSDVEYQVLWVAQNGLCAACGKPETKLHRNGKVLRLAVDHDHDTGKVNALLCSRCNYTLGYVRNDPTVLQGLIDYLARHYPEVAQEVLRSAS